MNKTLLPILFVFAILLSVGFSVGRIESGKSSAEASQIGGCYIFVDSRPLTPYDFLGTVELTPKDLRKNPGSGQYQYVRDLIIKKAKEKFPLTDGLIFNFHDGGIDKADAIKFK